jgi:hypothetical protein
MRWEEKRAAARKELRVPLRIGEATTRERCKGYAAIVQSITWMIWPVVARPVVPTINGCGYDMVLR